MDLRYCDRCDADVEDVGGFCLLGHPLRLEPLIPSVADWRAEIGRACEEAQGDTSAPAAATEPTTAGEAQPPALPAPAAPPERSVWRSLDEDRSTASGDPIEAFAPPARMDWGPRRDRFLVRSLRRGQPSARI